VADIALPHTITAGTTAAAAQVQENFDALADDALNKTGDTLEGDLVTQDLLPETTATYDLGTTDLRYRNLYISGSIDGLSAGNTFTTIAVSGQDDVEADTSSDTLTLAAGAGITLTTTAASDTVTIAASGSSQAGSSAIDFAAGGTIYQSVTAAGNVGAGEDTLYTKALAANLLANDGERLTFRACGTYANNTNSKRIKVKYGSTTIIDTGTVDPGSEGSTPWVLEGTITRLTATTQRCEATLNIGRFLLGTQYMVFVDSVTAGETLSGAVTFAITGEATSNNDVVLHTIAIEWHGRTAN
jgi:hypothetical protein